MIDNRFVIVVGLAGLDCEHGCATELHPVYALAIHVNDDPQDDTWAIFARNWGDEGYCSQDQHPLDATRIAFMLPRPGATAVAVASAATTFLTNDLSLAGPFVSLVANQGAVVEFRLPDPSRQARVNGELHLRWTVAPGIPGTLTARMMLLPRAITVMEPKELQPPGIEVEKRLQDMQAQLSPEARLSLSAKLARPKSFDELVPTALTAAQPKPARPATVRAVPDPQKAQKDLNRAQATCSAFNRNVPGVPNACASVPQ